MLRELSKQILDSLTNECTQVYGDRLVSVAVFGSVGRGTHTYTSDIDLLLVVENLPNGRMRRIQEFETVENRLLHLIRTAHEKGWSVSLSPVIRTPAEVRIGGFLYLDMVDDAIILYDRENYFSQFLDRYAQRLKDYGAKKIRWRGGWYWDIKPDAAPGEVISL